MAKKTTAEEERNVKVKAKVNLKYDSDVVKIGQELDIRQSDLEELQNKGYISYTPPVQLEQDDQTPPANN
ncbi:hypothetical protein [Clostridium kluyveri]|uniref:DUF7210 domain-containing protein n=1 Tax=Clostridium kluyveri TaxID=1534 RepID=A0A1L5FEF1_CLOKL|nr:hypothetical protein [Clostridium kluyveri]APM41392.1 hypothetical protein BS101_22045 [Clostridium kluyveri]